MPLGDSITFSYGDYEFDPRPLFTVSKEIVKTPSNIGLATRYSLTLEGQILPTGIDPTNGKAGLTKVLSGTNVLRDAFSRDFKLLLLQCNDDIALISGYPKIISIDVNRASDNYLQRADYAINLELASLTGGVSEPVGENANGGISGDLSASGLISVSDDFSIEFMDERIGGSIGLDGFGTIPSVFSIQRTLSAQGNPLAATGLDPLVYKEPWERAKDYVVSNLGLTPAMTGLSGLMCVSGMSIANNFRSVSVNKTEGTVNATETFIAYTGLYAATEEVEISVERSNSDPNTTVTVNGTIQGLSTIDYNVGIPEGCPPEGDLKFTNALASWNGGKSGSLYARANGTYKNSLPFNRPTGQEGHKEDLNIVPLSETVGYNPIVGTVIYSNTYNDRPDHVNAYALTESINYTWNHANDVFASLTVLGRTKGPLFQKLGTSGPRTVEMSIDSVMRTTPGSITGLGPEERIPYDDLITTFEGNLILLADVSEVLINSSNETWQPQVGLFRLNKSWTLSDC